MSIYTDLAAEIIERTKLGKDVDIELQKVAGENNLNKEETQRVVEEVNVGLFLDKMQQGLQHEDFKLATPVAIDIGETSGKKGTLEKEGSFSFNATPSMFDLSPVQDNTSMSVSTDINNHIMDSEVAWAENNVATQKVQTLEKVAELKSRREVQAINLKAQLAEAICNDASLVKTAISLIHEDDYLFRDDIYAAAKATKDEIIQSDITKESVAKLKKIGRSILLPEENDKLSGLSKASGDSAYKSFMGSAKDVGTLMAFPFKNPKTTIALGGGAYLAHKALTDKTDEKLRKQLIYNGGESS